MTAKLYQTVLLLCAITAIALFSSSCAEKDDILLEEEPEEVLEEIPIAPKPDWDDGVMTITVGGRFTTKGQMLRELEKHFLISHFMKDSIMNEKFTPTPSEKRYTVDIAVVTMLEAGITEPATLQEIKDAYWEKGYGPLTFEEVLELRLQLKDQPSSATGHRMSNFLTLPASNYTTPRTYHIQNVVITNKETKKEIGVSGLLKGKHLYNPNEIFLKTIFKKWNKLVMSQQELPIRFAVTARGSVVQQ